MTNPDESIDYLNRLEGPIVKALAAMEAGRLPHAIKVGEALLAAENIVVQAAEDQHPHRPRLHAAGAECRRSAARCECPTCVGADRGEARGRGQETGGASSQVEEVSGGGVASPHRAVAQRRS